MSIILNEKVRFCLLCPISAAFVSPVPCGRHIMKCTATPAALPHVRGDDMNKCILEMPSYTYAQKAERLLRSKGVQSEVKRHSTGCGTVLHVHTGCRAAAAILDRYGIPFILRETGSSP